MEKERDIPYKAVFCPDCGTILEHPRCICHIFCPKCKITFRRYIKGVAV